MNVFSLISPHSYQEISGTTNDKKEQNGIHNVRKKKKEIKIHFISTHTYSTNRSRRSINKMKRENSFPGLIQKAGGEGALFAKSKGTANGTL